MFGRAIYNTAAQLVGKIISSAIGFVTTLILAQALGVAHYGEFIKITAFISLFYPAVDFGLNAVFLRDYKNQVSAKLADFIALRLFLSLFWLTIANVAIYLLSFLNPAFTSVTRLGVTVGSLALVGYAVYLAVSSYFQNRQRLDIITAISVLGNILILILTVSAIKFISAQGDNGTVLTVGFVASGMLLSGLLSWLPVFKKTGLKLVFPRELFRRLFTESWPLGLTLIFNMFYFRADTLILASYLGNEAVGAYGLAYKFFEFMLTVPAFFMNSLYPMLIDKQTTAMFGAFFKKSVALIFGTGIILSALSFTGANLLYLVNSEYSASTPILQILSLFIPVFFLTSPLMWLLILQKKQKLLLMIYAFTATLNIILNLLLIPLYGAKGAALITGLSEVLVLILMLASIRYLGLWHRQTN